MLRRELLLEETRGRSPHVHPETLKESIEATSVTLLYSVLKLATSLINELFTPFPVRSAHFRPKATVSGGPRAALQLPFRLTNVLP